MGISVNWATKVITVAKVAEAYFTLVQASPTEIWQLDLNGFRLVLKDLEDDEAGIVYLDTHSHNPPVDVGGVTLSRVVEIINGYTVTFEDGQYAVNLGGANSNVGDVVNVNQVSVRSANSAGLVTSAAIEFGEYQGRVTIDTANTTGAAVAGSVYPTGTLRQPSNNVPDALVIAAARGFTTAYFLGDLTLDTGHDADGLILLGTSHIQSVLTVNPGASVMTSVFKDCEVVGTLDGDNQLNDCIVGDLTYFSGHIHTCGLKGKVTLSGADASVLSDCNTIDPNSPPTVDMGGSDQDLSMPNFSGLLTIENMTGGYAGVGLLGGQVILDSTVTGGTVFVSGVGLLTDAGGNRIDSGTWNGVTIINTTVSTVEIVEEVWAKVLP